MKRKEKLGMILTMMILIPIISAYGETTNHNPITLNWKLKGAPENTSWTPRHGDLISVYGTIHAGFDSTFEIGDSQSAMGFTMTDPAGEIIALGQEEPTCNYDTCDFEWIFSINEKLLKHTGKYPIRACYHGYNNGQSLCATTDISIVVTSDYNTANKKPDTSDDAIAQLQKENWILKQQVSDLQSEVKQLENQIDNLNQIIQEQIKVIYQWVTNN